MKKYKLGIFLGIVAGIIDILPMIAQKLTWDANLSAFSLWVVCGFLISSSNLKINGILKGVGISTLVLLPTAFLVGWKQPSALIPIMAMTLLLGSGLGFFIDKFSR